MAREKITIYEKPTWSTCREVKRVLTEKGVEFDTVNYLEHPPSALELKKLLREAGLKPHEAVRKKELHELAGDRQFSDDELLQFMAKHPEVIQRPLVVKGSKAVLARPVERLRDLDL